MAPAKKPTDNLTAQLLAALTAAKVGEGQVATVNTPAGSYVGPTTLVWYDNAGVPVVMLASIVSDGRTVLVPWHAVRSIEPAVPPK